MARLASQYGSPKIAAGLGILVFFALVGVVGPLFFHGSATAPTAIGMHPPSSAHLLGTTLQGQDVLHQLVNGTASSLEVGFLAAIVGTVVAVVAGLLAGYLRGAGGEALSLISNVFLVIPSLPLVIVLAGYLPRSGILSIAVVIAVTTWAGGARVVRAQTLTMADRDYVQSARALGEPTRRIVFAEILPNLSTIVMSTFLFAVIVAIATEAGLAFLGLGNIDQVSWGYMIYWAQTDNAVLAGAWWWWIPPGACYALVGAALGLINFGIDEVGNPRLRMARVAAKAERLSRAQGIGSRTGRGVGQAPPSTGPAASSSGMGGGSEVPAAAPYEGRLAAVSGDAEPGSMLLEVRGLRVGYLTERGTVVALPGASFELRRGEVLGIAGESGSGKSTLVHAVTRLIHPPGVVLGGSVLYHGTPRRGRPGHAVGGQPPAMLRAGNGPWDLLRLGPDELRALRWEELAIVFQSAMNALNPVLRIEEQLVDAILAHRPEVKGQALAAKAAELLRMVNVAPERARAFPHELSGGTRQRVVLAMALALEPELLVLDEPTTGLDVVVQRAILNRVLDLRARLGFSVIFVTHDLPLLLEACDRVIVMYAGQAVEVSSVEEVARDPLHPYTDCLMHAFPPLDGPRVSLAGIPGSPPDPDDLPPGCTFAPRCPRAFDPCFTEQPELSLLGDRSVRCHLHSGVRRGRYEGGNGSQEAAAGRKGLGQAPVEHSTQPVSTAATPSDTGGKVR